MEWNNGNNNHLKPTFLSQSASFNFLYNYNHHYPGTAESKQQGTVTETPQTAHGGMRDMILEDMNMMQVQQHGMSNEKIKKRMTSEQLEFLESRFQEEMKLEPDRKIKLARELALQPRQVAVWFQNRRARWKTKQLEHLYLSLKHQLDLVSMEKHKLQEEVVALRAILKEEVTRKQAWGSCSNNNNSNTADMISGEDTVESTSVVFPNSSTRNNHESNIITAATHHHCNYVFNADAYNNSANWGAASAGTTAAMPSYP